MENEFEKRHANATARGIANEKTRESIAVYKVIGAVLLAWVVGAVAGSVLAGVVVMLLLFVPIWRTYNGNPITHKWYRRAVVGFWVALGALVVLSAGSAWWMAANDTTPAQPDFVQSPEQIRRQQIQAATDIGEAQLVAHIKANMGDPDSFELVSDRAIDAGDHITMVMVYRGRNGFNALRKETVGATFDLKGNLTTVNAIDN